MKIFLITLLFASINSAYFSNETDEDFSKFLEDEYIENILLDENSIEPLRNDWIFNSEEANLIFESNFETENRIEREIWDYYDQNPMLSINLDEWVLDMNFEKTSEEINGNQKNNIIVSEFDKEILDNNEIAKLKNSDFEDKNLTLGESFINSEKKIVKHPKPDKKGRKKIVKHPKTDKKGRKKISEVPFYYLISRFCYEKRITNTTELSFNGFGDKIYGDEMEEFRQKFKIKKEKKKKSYYRFISNYFNKKDLNEKKRCLSNITRKKAIENELYWKTKAKELLAPEDFEYLKKVSDTIFSLNYGNLIFYLLSRFCYEKRITKTTEFSFNGFGDKIFGDEMEEFRKKFNMAHEKKKDRCYPFIRNYFNKKDLSEKKRCLSNITRKKAIENILYWRTDAKKHPDYKYLKEICDILFPSSSDEMEVFL